MSEAALDDKSFLSRLLRRQRLDRDLQLALVRSLFRPIGQVVFSTLVAATVMAYAHHVSGDPAYVVLGVAMCVVGSLRYASLMAFRLVGGREDEVISLDAWEYVAMAGAFAFASLVGITSGYGAWSCLDPEAEMLVMASGLSYATGIAGRNVARREIVMGQAVCACVPMFIGCVLRMDVPHLVMATITGLSGALALSLASYLARTMIEKNRFEKERADEAERNRFLADHDILTGLRNRKGFLSDLDGTLAVEGIAGRGALVLIDLDRFKEVNDKLGHHVGDKVLQNVGRRITESIRAGDEAARISGDEFHVILAGVDRNVAEDVTRRIHAELSRPHVIDGVVVPGGASVGIAMFEEGDDPDAVMVRVDTAMYASKGQGRGRVTMHTEAIRAEFERRKRLEEDLPAAIATDQVHLHYQPIVDCRDDKVRSCEALVRWNHPVLGPVNPMEFIGVAERTGCIVELGRKVLRKACADAMSLPDDVSVAVNVSPVQFEGGEGAMGVVHDVAMALAESGLPARRLEIEITESVFLGDKPRVKTVLSTLAGLGVRISLDDFGEGQTSLAHVKDYEFHKIKLDKKFTDAVLDSPRALAVVRAIRRMADDIGMDLVMEGVEHGPQLDCVAAQGIHLIQGWFYSKAVPLAEVMARIASMPADAAAKRSVETKPLEAA